MNHLGAIRHNKEDLVCGICLKYIACAVTTKCGHAFCDICILEFLLVSSDCIICNKKLRHTRKFATCKNLDNIIETFVKDLNDKNEEFNDYKYRVQMTKEWHKERKIEQLKVGMRVDVRSPEYVWTTGIIRKIAWRMDLNTKIALVHYEGFPNIYDEEIWESSARLAKHGFFTERTDIPKIQLNRNGMKVLLFKGKKLDFNFLHFDGDNEPFGQLVDSEYSISED